MTTEEKLKKAQFEIQELKEQLKKAQSQKLMKENVKLKERERKTRVKNLRLLKKMEESKIAKQKTQFEMQQLKEDVITLKGAIQSQAQYLRLNLFFRFGSQNERSRKLFNIPKGLADIDANSSELSDNDKEILKNAAQVCLDEEKNEDDYMQSDESQEGKQKGGQNQKAKKNSKSSKRKGISNPSRGKQAFDKGYPREIREYEVNGGICPRCGVPLVRIGNGEIREHIDLIKENLQIIQERYYKSYCPVCGVTKDKNGKIIKKEILTPQVANERYIPGGLVGNTLLATTAVDKYVYGLSLIRLSKRFRDFGVELSKQNFSNWFLRLGLELGPLAEEIRKSIIAFNFLGADETRYQVLREDERSDEKLSWIWVLSGYDPQRPAAYYRYNPSRSGKVFKDIIGEDFQGYLMTDAYQVYTGNKQGFRYQSCLCLAHLRRKFVDAFKAVEGLESPRQIKLQQIINIIGNLFSLEGQLRPKFESGVLSEEEFVQKRKEKALPLFRKLNTVIMNYSTQNKMLIDPLFESAITYYKNNKDGFMKYLDIPWFSPHNNRSEAYVKAAILVRTNSLFAGSPNGAIAMSNLETVLQTAYLNKLNLVEYTNYLLGELTQMRDKKAKDVDYTRLRPWNLQTEMKDKINIKTISQLKDKKL